MSNNLKTGFDGIDSQIGALSGGRIIVLCSRPGAGKTTLAAQLALNFSRLSGKSVVFFSLEATQEHIKSILLSCVSGINLRSGRDSVLTGEEKFKMKMAENELRKTALDIRDDYSLNANDIRKRVTDVSDLGLIVIDYLSLLEPICRGKSSIVDFLKIGSELNTLTMELNVPVLLINQAIRSAENYGRGGEPTLDDVRFGRTLSHFFDVILYLVRDEDRVRLKVLKNSRGDADIYIDGKFDPRVIKFKF